jgi:peroxiredoxin
MDLEFDVVDLGPTNHVETGDTAPEFTRPLVGAEYWEDASLSDLIGDQPVVLLFHPMNGSFPATYVWQAVTDRAWHERATVVGVSIATPYDHKRLIEERDLGDDYRLFADPANGVAETYGIAHDLDGMAGVSEPRPAAFVVDSEQVVQYAWVADQWPAFPDYDAIEDAIDALA